MVDKLLLIHRLVGVLQPDQVRVQRLLGLDKLARLVVHDRECFLVGVFFRRLKFDHAIIVFYKDGFIIRQNWRKSLWQALVLRHSHVVIFALDGVGFNLGCLARHGSRRNRAECGRPLTEVALRRAIRVRLLVWDDLLRTLYVRQGDFCLSRRLHRFWLVTEREAHDLLAVPARRRMCQLAVLQIPLVLLRPGRSSELAGVAHHLCLLRDHC